jgi:hypothetical protein
MTTHAQPPTPPKRGRGRPAGPLKVSPNWRVTLPTRQRVAEAAAAAGITESDLVEQVLLASRRIRPR